MYLKSKQRFTKQEVIYSFSPCSSVLPLPFFVTVMENILSKLKVNIPYFKNEMKASLVQKKRLIN